MRKREVYTIPNENKTTKFNGDIFEDKYLTASAICIYISLCAMFQKGYRTPSWEDISQNSRVKSFNAIRKGLELLEKRGYISIQDNGKGRAKTYKVFKRRGDSQCW